MSAERPNDQLDYDEACQVHADNQGLTPIGELLTAAGIPWNLEQTGGFCMVINVNHRDADRYVWVTATEAGALIGVYDVESGELIGETDAEGYTDVTLAALVATVEKLRSWPAPRPEAALSFDECEAAGVDGTLRGMT